MSLAPARHGAHLPAGFSWPAPMPVDPERTAYLTPEAVRAAIAEKERSSGPAYLPAWKVASSGISKPSADTVRELSKVACAYRDAGRKDYARAWLEFCLCGGDVVPGYAAHRLTPQEARAIQLRFSKLGAFDPRDFQGVPF